MSSYEREELRREEFEHDNPRCRAHGVHGCRECDDAENREAMGVEEPGEIDFPLVACPEHGAQPIVRMYASRGSDPYNVDVGKCGCHVMAFSKDEVMVVRRDV